VVTRFDPINLGNDVEVRISLADFETQRRVQIVVRGTRGGRLFGHVSIEARYFPAVIGRLLAAEARADQLGWLKEPNTHPRERRRQQRVRTPVDPARQTGADTVPSSIHGEPPVRSVGLGEAGSQPTERHENIGPFIALATRAGDTEDNPTPETDDA
jgi:hypothetical protein